MTERETIENEQNYRRLKVAIIAMMDRSLETEWYTDQQWHDKAASWLGQNEYHQIVKKMLNDSEIEREYDRVPTPPKTRWVMREE